MDNQILQNERTDVIKVGDWVLTMLILAIPLVGLIMLFVWAFGSGTNPSKANFAKAALIWVLIGIVLCILFFSVFAALITSTMKSEPEKLTAYNSEAFAFNIGESWEVNASARIKGFQQNEKDTLFSVHLTFITDLVTNSGDTIKNVFQDEVKKSGNKALMDFPLEAQFELDSTYQAGEYELFFIVKDELSGSTAKTSAKFELSND